MSSVLNTVFAVAVIASLVINFWMIAERYQKNVAERMRYGAPQGALLSIMNRGFWKDEGGWHNE